MERVLSPLCPSSGMLSAGQASSSSDDTSSSSDETDVEVIGTHPQACYLPASDPPRSLAGVRIPVIRSAVMSAAGKVTAEAEQLWDEEHGSAQDVLSIRVWCDERETPSWMVGMECWERKT